MLGVLCCFALFVCLTLLASFFHLSLKTCTVYVNVVVYIHVKYIYILLEVYYM